MKIEEIFKIYEFLGQLSIWAFLGISLLILIIVAGVLLPFRNQINLSWRALGFVEAIVLVSLVVLFLEAKKRSNFLPIANAIKTNYVYSGYYQKSLRQLGPIVYILNDTLLLKELKQIPEQYPSDFILIHMYSSVDKPTDLDTLGLRVTDPITLEKIEKKIDETAQTVAPIISTFMKQNSLKTISTDYGKELWSIDNEGWLIGQNLFKRLVGKNGLMPIYDTRFSYPVEGYNITGFTLLQTDTTIHK